MNSVVNEFDCRTNQVHSDESTMTESEYLRFGYLLNEGDVIGRNFSMELGYSVDCSINQDRLSNENCVIGSEEFLYGND